MKFGRNGLHVNTRFQMAAMKSFHAENCCHLVSEHETSGQRQFLVGSIFVSLV